MNSLPELQLELITHGEIVGLDPCTEGFLSEIGFEPDHQVPFEHWDPITARLTYLSSPIIVTPRKAGFHVLGSGRAWRQAEQLFKGDEKFPVLVLQARRLTDDLKLRILAADLLGQFASHRTRPHLPKRMLSIWQAFTARGIASILGKSIKAFSRGSGYSLRALLPPKSKEIHFSGLKPDSVAPDDGKIAN